MKLRFKTCLLMVPLLAAGGFLSACGGGDSSSPPTPVPSLARSTLAVTPATALVADGSATAHIKVQLRDADGNAITNSTADVTLQADFGNLDYSDDNGHVTGTLNSTQAGDDTVSFSINGSVSPNTGTITFVAGPADPDASSIALSSPGPGTSAAPTGIADGVSPLIATVTLRDQYANPLHHGGADVRISTGLGAVGRIIDHRDGTYTADITSIAAGSGTATFSLSAASAGSAAQARSAAPSAATGGSVLFVPPPASAASVYMAPWTVQSCDGSGGCIYSDIYEADTSDPAGPAVHVVSGALMPGYNSGYPRTFATVYRAYYDRGMDRIQQLGPATLVYAKDEALHRLDLTTPGATPERLSTLSPTVICSFRLIGPYGITFGFSPAGGPAWIVVEGFDSAGATPGDCAGGSPQGWLVPVAGDATTTPLSGDYRKLFGAKALVDPATGRVEGLVVVDDAGDLQLYSPDLAYHTVLQSGFAPSGSHVEVLNYRGLGDHLVMNVSSTSGGTRHDALYRVTESGASHVTSLSFSTANPYFDASECGSRLDASTYYLYSQEDSTGTVYFSYPTSSGGFTIKKLGPADAAPTDIYNEPPGYCLSHNSLPVYSTSGKLLFTEEATPDSASPNAFREIAIDAAGPVGQTPIVLASDANAYGLYMQYYSAIGDNAWVFIITPTAARVLAVKPDGTVQHTFMNSKIGGDAQEGVIASFGATLRKYLGIAPYSDTATCTSSGWVLYDPVTLAPVLSPDFGAGNCSEDVFLYGPNDNFFLGSVHNDGHTQAYAYALFGIGGTGVAFGPYGPAPGYSVPNTVPMY